MVKLGAKNTDFNTLWRQIERARTLRARGYLSYTADKAAGEDSHKEGGKKMIVLWYWVGTHGLVNVTKEEDEQALADLCDCSSGMNINGCEVAVMEEPGFSLLLAMEEKGQVRVREVYDSPD